MIKRFDKLLYEALIKKGLISREALDTLLKEVDASDESLQQLLIKKGLLLEKDILDTLAEELELRRISLKEIPIDKSVLDKVPVKIASYYRFLPIAIKDGVLTIAVASPLDIKMQDEIRTQVGCDIELALSSLNDISEGLQKYYGLAAETLGRITSQQVSKPEASSQEAFQEEVEDIEKLAEDASVIKLVNQIILEGWRKRATDIHIEPYRGKVALRYRIDGLLYDANVPPEMKNFLNAIISRIKIMSSLDIVERRLPQDGRAIVRVQDQVLDLRISTIPTPFGESLVIRILPTTMLFDLSKLGLSKRNLQIFEGFIQRPHGIIFVTGPTGSGKTTTLYACLRRINTRERKIITIEEPIEYEMTGITQMQVMREIGLDFAHGLRNVLRHDPDVIMIGEVRDLETAEIAIRVALTGHLIFSTLHTNDAASAITRLLDIGVEPYLVASSVVAFIAQRLIRLICPDCKYEDKKVSQELKDLISRELGLKTKDINLFKGKGCPNCNFTGFFGRTAIYEILLIDEAMRDLILKKTSSDQIKKVAISRGMETLRQDGFQKVVAGLTTPEEVMKVTSGVEYSAVEKKAQLPTAADFQKEEDSQSLSQSLTLGGRVYSRLNSKVNLSYRIFKTPEELSKQGLTPEQLSVTKNISAGGLLFVANEPLPINAILELKIELPDGEKPIECLAKIVRIEEMAPDMTYDIAACFLDITGAQRVRLNRYVESELGSR